MTSKYLLPKNVANRMYQEFRKKIGDLASAAECPLTESAIAGAFMETLEKTCVIVDEHGNVLRKEKNAIFTDPNYNPEPGTY